MKAIVLTCDKNRLLTDHMIHKYEQLWPDHPFLFRVPYQEVVPATVRANVEFRRTPVAIKSTVLTLLDDLSDDELVYWCIDDKYPIQFDLPRVRSLLQWLVCSGNEMEEVSGVLFCRCRKMLIAEYLTGETLTDDRGLVCLERKGYEQIWIHQFLRVGVLRYLFNAFPDDIPQARLMDGYKDAVKKPNHHRIYVTEKNLAVFGESTSYGRLTANCLKSICEWGGPLSDYAGGTLSEEITLGVL